MPFWASSTLVLVFALTLTPGTVAVIPARLINSLASSVLLPLFLAMLYGFFKAHR
jgi:hypothetical protein